MANLLTEEEIWKVEKWHWPILGRIVLPGLEHAQWLSLDWALGWYKPGCGFGWSAGVGWVQARASQWQKP
jgi:hypothetical protein